MGHIKLFLISILLLFLVVSFVFALFPSHIRISRVVLVPASKEKTASVIRDFNSWKQWNQLLGDSSVTTVAGGEAVLEANGVRVSMLPGAPDSIRCLWTPVRGRAFNGGFNILAEGKDTAHVTVEWYFDFYFRWYPWEKLKSMFYDKQLGPVMEKSLVALSSYVGNH